MALPGLSEKSFQATVTEAARVLGWRVYHTFNSRRSSPGFPDLVLVRNGRLVFAELKSEGGRVRPGQIGWLQDLTEVVEHLGAAGAHGHVEVYSWRPRDWPQVSEVLR